MPLGPPTPDLSGGDNRIKEQAASAIRPTSPLLQQSLSSYNIRPLQDKVNGSAEECNHSNNNKDGENDIDEGRAKNDVDKSKAKDCNNGSDDSSDTDNNFGDSDSYDSNSCDGNKGNKAYRYTK